MKPSSLPLDPEVILTPALTQLRQRWDSPGADVDSRTRADAATAILITNETNVQYLTGFTGDSTWCLVPREGRPLLLSDQRYQTQLRQQCPGLGHRIRTPDVSMLDLLGQSVAQCLDGDAAIEFEADDVTVATMQQWTKAMPTVRWIAAQGTVEALRMVKTAEEVAKIKRAIEVAERAFGIVTSGLTDAMTERQVAHALEAAMRSLGATGASFPPIVGVDAGAALPHYQPSDRQLAGGRVLLIDWGALVDGYASDLTRTLHRFGSGDDAMRQKFEQAYDATHRAAAAGLASIAPGIATAEVDAAARSVLADAGLAEAFKHGLGHGFGRAVHESPRLGSTSKETLAAGMVVTIEPGVYFEGEFGIRIEDDVLVTDAGARPLSTLPSGLESCRWVV